MLTRPDSASAAPRQAAERCCPACGSGEREALPAYSEGEWSVVECRACGFVYLANPPGYAALVDDYAWEKTSKVEKAWRAEHRPVSSTLRKALRWRFRVIGGSVNRIMGLLGGGRILDIGCGKGRPMFMEGCTPFGIEISRELHAQADAKMRAKGGYAVHAPAIDGLASFEDRSFDGVIMHSYLEHEEHPGPVLAEVARVLKPGGRAYVRVPNYGSLNRRVRGRHWCGFRYPDHVNYFTEKSLRTMAGSAGFGARLVNWLNLPIDDNIKMLLVKQ